MSIFFYWLSLHIFFYGRSSLISNYAASKTGVGNISFHVAVAVTLRATRYIRREDLE
jgi:hypothetical protein